MALRSCSIYRNEVTFSSGEHSKALTDHLIGVLSKHYNVEVKGQVSTALKFQELKLKEMSFRYNARKGCHYFEAAHQSGSRLAVSILPGIVRVDAEHENKDIATKWLEETVSLLKSFK